MTMHSPESPKSKRSRIDWNAISEAFLSVLVVLVVLIGIVWSLPGAHIQQRAVSALAPIARVAGLEQNWRMFSPDPPRQNSQVEVVVTMADGEEREWTFERAYTPMGPFNWDRWRKFEEQIIARPETRAEFAQWVVRELTEPAERAVRVRVFVNTESLAPPGTADPIKKQRKLLYSKKLAGRP